jgi:hypothetical protein
VRIDPRQSGLKRLKPATFAVTTAVTFHNQKLLQEKICITSTDVTEGAKNGFEVDKKRQNNSGCCRRPHQYSLGNMITQCSPSQQAQSVCSAKGKR